MSNFLTPAQAAEFLNVCTKTLRRWESAGRLDVIRTPTGHRRYTREELVRAMVESTQQHRQAQAERPST